MDTSGVGLATGRSVVHEILTAVYKEHSEIRRTGAGPHWTVMDSTLDIVQGVYQVNKHLVVTKLSFRKVRNLISLSHNIRSKYVFVYFKSYALT
jgi:hypothetical protein